MNYKIIGDSCMDLTAEMAEDRAHFSQVPLLLQLGEHCILDDVHFDQADFLKQMHACPLCPKTACPSPEEFQKAYECGAENIFVVTITAKLSGTYNAAVLGKELYEEAHGAGRKNIAVINSASGTAGETAVALLIRDLCEAGHSFEEVAAIAADYASERMQTFFVLEHLEALRKNGRLSGTAALFATALNIKPVLFADHGEIKKFDTARGLKKALTKLCETVVKRAQEAAEKKHLHRAVITQCNCPERAEEVREMLLTLAPFDEVLIAPTGGVSTIYASDGGIVVAI